MACQGVFLSIWTIFVAFISILNVIEGAPSCSFVNKIGVCNLQWSVSNVTLSIQKETLQQINSTLAGITTLPVKDECIEAIRRILCRKHFPSCSSATNSTSKQTQQECKEVTGNCSAFIAKIYASTVCPSIPAYTDTSVCVVINVTSGGYCPVDEVYKTQAKDVVTFLERANLEKDKFVNIFGNDLDHCGEIYRKIHCQSFVPSCSDVITKGKCEQALTCLSSNSTLNRTELCSKFPNEKQTPTTQDLSTSTTTTSPTMVTTPSTVNSTKTMVTFQLENIQYNKDYENKTTPSYILLSKTVTDALNEAYVRLDGFIAVEMLDLTCNNEISIKHYVITVESTAKPSMETIKAWLTIATKSGYLKDKIKLSTIMAFCEIPPTHDHEENNWVYMIIFVCITALLLLAMVLCNQ